MSLQSPRVAPLALGEPVLPVVEVAPLSSPPILTAYESEPSTGLGFIIPGWILTGVGALNLVTMPVCFAGWYQDFGVREVCIGASIGFAAVGLGLGIPFLIVGYNKRSKYKRWEANQVDEFSGPTRFLDRAAVVPLPGGAAATYSLQF
jgi:hypothetical protein